MEDVQMAGGDIPPNQTLYVNNLNEKVKKDVLKTQLYAVFSQFGPVIDVIVGKNYRLRGQAWVVFQDQASSSNALRSLQGFPFMDKPMRITYAKEKSDVIAEDEDIPIDKATRAERRKEKEEEFKQREKEKRKQKKQKTGGTEGKKPSKPLPNQRQEPPNKILFVENLPLQCNEQMLQVLFQQFPGFVEVRMVPGKRGIAFVEFQTEEQSTLGMKELQHFKFTQDDIIVISYAKK